MASVFRTTYVCELTFSKMKYVNSAHRTNELLKEIILVGCSNSKANIDYIVKAKRQGPNRYILREVGLLLHPQ